MNHVKEASRIQKPLLVGEFNLVPLGGLPDRNAFLTQARTLLICQYDDNAEPHHPALVIGSLAPYLSCGEELMLLRQFHIPYILSLCRCTAICKAL